MGIRTKFPSEAPIGEPSPNGERGTRDWMRKARDEMRVDILDRIVPTASGTKAARAR